MNAFGGYSGLADGINVGVDVTNVVVGNGYHIQGGNIAVGGAQDAGYSGHYDSPVGPINIGVDVLNLVAGNGADITFGNIAVGTDQSLSHHF
jgi:hypothetical protein